MEKLTTLIVDDETLARRGLYLRLRDCADVDTIGECVNGRQALAAILQLEPDLVFLDIQMPGMDGFEVVRSLQQDNMPAIVFVTAFDQFAIQAFDVYAVDYLLKPVDEQHLRRALDRAHRYKQERQHACDKQKLLGVIGAITGKAPSELMDFLAQNEPRATGYPEKLRIRDGAGVTLLPLAEIDWIDAAGDYMCVHAGAHVHVMRSTLKALEDQLDPRRFLRIHRSTIVNIHRIRAIIPHMNGDYHLDLEGGMRLKMSRSYKDRLSQLTSV